MQRTTTVAVFGYRFKLEGTPRDCSAEALAALAERQTGMIAVRASRCRTENATAQTSASFSGADLAVLIREASHA